MVGSSRTRCPFWTSHCASFFPKSFFTTLVRTIKPQPRSKKVLQTEC